MQTDQLNLEQELFYQSDQDSKQLFDLYRSLHFIYPAKMEKLNPVFNIVEENWEKATKLDFPLCETTFSIPIFSDRSNGWS